MKAIFMIILITLCIFILLAYVTVTIISCIVSVIEHKQEEQDDSV